MEPTDEKPTRTDAMPSDEAVFTLTFNKGLADRNRLPFDQIIKTLTEFEEMVREVGKRVQRAAGQEEATGDFGLEIVAGPGNFAFRKGSVIATVVATRDLENARSVFRTILSQSKDYSKRVAVDDSVEGGIVAKRMFKIARLQVPAKSLVAFQLKGAPRGTPKTTIDERAYVHLLKASKKLLKIEGLQLFGKLKQLKDRSKTENTDRHFWGELITDQQETWRLRFEPGDLKKVLPLFMQQVSVTGDATYFGPAKNPRLRVQHIAADSDRDYLKAYDELRSNEVKLFGEATTEEILQELYG